MTGSTLAALAASLLFSYVPGFKDWYSTKDPYLKRLIMLALVIVVAMGAFSLACVVGPRMHAFAGLADDFSVKVTCDAFGAWGLVRRDRRRCRQPGRILDLSQEKLFTQ